ncbi:hypothetical protein HXZ64_09300 [Acinetobacter indicus]|uniref:hypothetical protein n=1 Tax=Acinetobacter indicus TaxID=756892 RepID=UPI0025754CE7|nr:hypothetical protein [Acinetobacter indicus]MDM1281149.1 hypothetical protein [Acinetobacter indicus]
MRFKEKFGITDPDHEFFDINIYVDTKKFVDPYCVSQTPTFTGVAAQRCISFFMKELLTSIQNQTDTYSSYLCSRFNEPNGTRLGYSKVKRDGSGAGDHLAALFLQELKRIRHLIQNGIFNYLEECSLLCDELKFDRISDITIDIIKLPLIEFTQIQCHKYGIKMRKTKSKLSYFSISTGLWKEDYFELPHIDDSEEFLILIPRTFIPKVPTYNPMYFYTNTAQEHFKRQAIFNNDSCVSRDRKENTQVLSKDLRISEQYKPSKSNIKRGILEKPELLLKYRNEIAMDIYIRNFRK